MKKEMSPVTKATLLGITEGAAIGVVKGLPFTTFTHGLSPVIFGATGAVTGGATAYAAERFMQSKRENAVTKQAAKTQNSQESTVPTTSLGNDSGVFDVSVESISSTQRTDVPEADASPIVKSSTEQASNISANDLSDTLAALRARTQTNAFPAWRTTINEKTVASTNSASVYDHAPQRVS